MSNKEYFMDLLEQSKSAELGNIANSTANQIKALKIKYEMADTATFWLKFIALGLVGFLYFLVICLDFTRLLTNCKCKSNSKKKPVRVFPEQKLNSEKEKKTLEDYDYLNKDYDKKFKEFELLVYKSVIEKNNDFNSF